jgi:predicted phosphodiesterase
MRIAIVSDIHSNLAALEAVLADAGAVAELWCPGDVVGYGPNPNECIEVLRQRHALCVAGNHDWAAIGRLPTTDFNPDAAAAAHWTADKLTPENKRYLEDLPLTETRGDFTIVHGTLSNPIWEYLISTLQAGETFALLKSRCCLVGHTHVPVAFVEVGRGKAGQPFQPPLDHAIKLGTERLIFNPGSVGQPRDGIPEASYALFDSDAKTIQLRRVPYDIQRTQRLMQLNNLPPRLWQRLSYGW